MTIDTIEAIHAAIKHWEELRDNPKENSIVRGHCPLCIMYPGYTDDNNDYHHCSRPMDTSKEKCPIYTKTQRKYCVGTPYKQAAILHQHIMDALADPQCDDWINAAQAEIDFLKSLLI